MRSRNAVPGRAGHRAGPFPAPYVDDEEEDMSESKRETCKWAVHINLPKGTRCEYPLPKWLVEAAVSSSWHAGNRSPNYVTNDTCSNCPCYQPRETPKAEGRGDA